MSTLTYTDIISLDETSFIAGTKMIFTFPVYQNDELISLLGATASWSLSYFGTEKEILTKTGTILLTTLTSSGASSLGVEIVLEPSDTINLWGKFIQQLTLTDFYESSFIPAQGVIIILPAIGTDVVAV